MVSLFECCFTLEMFLGVHLGSSLDTYPHSRSILQPEHPESAGTKTTGLENIPKSGRHEKSDWYETRLGADQLPGLSVSRCATSDHSAPASNNSPFLTCFFHQRYSTELSYLNAKSLALVSIDATKGTVYAEARLCSPSRVASAQRSRF